ncbi:hypothetical protein [Amycolatopsis sp. MEPSY49]|uniref:hypothetical protein n=1 Tax=Amycolatopsis sp. MEPSY49 TaxID=3151600 RepID=UPI003EFA0E08
MIARTLDAPALTIPPLPTPPTATGPIHRINSEPLSVARASETPPAPITHSEPPVIDAGTHEEPTQPATSRQDTPAVQRAPEPAPEPAPTPASPPPETEELVKKLFDPLLRRLKTELRLDRERRGALTDRPH